RRPGDPRRRGHQAARRASRRQQRRGGSSHPQRGEPPAGDAGRHDGRCGRQGRRAGERLRQGELEMTIYLNKDSKVIVQGITGGMGSKHTDLMLQSGANIVGGVNARKAGTTVELNGETLPVYGTVEEAMKETGADVSVAFVPPAFTKAACIEAIDAEIPLLVVITEGVPVQDTAEVFAYRDGKKTRMIGPNCPGIISPGESLAGITPHTIAGKGPIGLVSKSGTLTYQMMYELRDYGFTTAIGIGRDRIIGTRHTDALEASESAPATK